MKMILLLAALAILLVAGLPVILAALKQIRFDIATNSYGDAGTHANGVISRTADAVHTLRHLVVKEGSTAGTGIAVCGLNARPIGVCLDTPETIGDPAAVKLLGTGGTVLMVASAAITAGAAVYTAANGKISSTGASTSWFLGFAVTAAAADGDPVEVATTIPLAAQA